MAQPAAGSAFAPSTSSSIASSPLDQSPHISLAPAISKAASSRSRASSRDSQINGSFQSSRLNTLPSSSPPSLGGSQSPSSSYHSQLTRPTVQTAFGGLGSSGGGNGNGNSSGPPSSSSLPGTSAYGLAPPILLSLTGPSATNTPLSSPSSEASSSSGFRVLSRPARTTGPPPIGDPNKPISRGSTAPSSHSSSAATSPLQLPTPLATVFGSTAPLAMSVSNPVSAPSPPSPPSNSRQSSYNNNTTPRRPSLLTQQILSSPAISLATTFNSQANDQVAESSHGSMGPPPLPSGGGDFKRRGSLKDKLMGQQHAYVQKGKLAAETAGLRLDTSAVALSTASGSTSELSQAGTPHGVTRIGSLHRGRSYNMGGPSGSSGVNGEGWKTPVSGGSTASGSQAQRGAPGSAAEGEHVMRWKSPTEIDEDEVIETADLMFGKDQNTGRKMINQYLILQEIGRGQHGQVRLGQDLSSPESSRAGSSMGIHSALENSTMTPPLQPMSHFASAPGTPIGDGSHGMHVPGNFWAIKIVDRQPRKKLPGMRKLGAVGVPEASVANEKLKREIAILKKCRHPNVVRLREVIDAPISKKIYLILEYCEAGEVKWKSEDGRPLLTVAEARKVFRDVVCGLEYLHHQGIIHRDIKPANLLYSGDGLVKISDFGVSHYSHVLRGSKDEGSGSPEEDEPGFVDEHDLAKTAGSPAFFAPELCYNGDGTPSGSNTPAAHQTEFNLHSGANMDSLNNRLSSLSAASGSTARPGSPMRPRRKRPPITQAIDIWALGVTLYCLLFGRVPFDSTSEYALFSIIPVEDFAVPETMGADSMWTGGRLAFKTGPKNGLVEEACEVIDLLEKLLTKDPTKRITLEAVKRHPFTLRDITDKPAWLASTDPKTESHVTVSNDEVAAAVTNSGSFFKSVKRGVKHLSNKLNIFSSTGSKTRSRSHSIVGGNAPGLSEFGLMTGNPESQPPSATGTLNQVPSPAVRSTGRMPSNPSVAASASQSSNSDQGHSHDHASPRGTATPLVARRMSWLQSSSSLVPKPSIERTRSPVGDQIYSGPSSANPLTTLSSQSDGSDHLGRSYSDRSTRSSAGAIAPPRLQPSRRQSTHLVPPHTSSPRLSNRALSTSTSAEALDQMIANAIVVEKGVPLSARAIRLRNKQSADMDAAAYLSVAAPDARMGRPRSESTTSSGGLQRIARLFTRNQSHKSNSTSGSNISVSRQSQERLAEVARIQTDPRMESQRSPDQELISESLSVASGDPLGHRKSGETLASSLYASSRAELSSPELSKTTLPPLSMTDWDGRQAFGMSPERPGLTRNSTEMPTRSVDVPDWTGNLSDDDDEEEDYGREAVSAYDRVPNSIDDLRTGSWRLDSRGWRGQSHTADDDAPEEALGLTVPQPFARAYPLGDSINLGDNSPSDSPATLTGPARSWSTEESPQHPPISSSLESRPKMSPPPSPVHAYHPEFRNRSMSRNSQRGSPLRLVERQGPERTKSPLGRTPLELAATRFMDALEDDEDGDDAEEDGLAMDFGKRGRRFSKPNSQSESRKMSFGS